MANDTDDKVSAKVQALEESMARVNDALARTQPGGAPAGQKRQDASTFVPGSIASIGLALAVIGLATGNAALVILGVLVGGLAGAIVAAPQIKRALGPPKSLPAFSDRPHIGLGAEIEAGAIVEPGATVEMGATLGARSIVRAGAVVRMGSHVHEDCVIEAGAIVSWGADVHEGSVVGEKAIVGAGSDVAAGSRVPAGLWLKPGADYAGGSAGPAGATTPGTAAIAAQAAAIAPPAVDPAEARVAAACVKLEAELRAAPDRVRDFLGASHELIASLRGTCEDLFRRQRALREEASPALLARLDEERAVLEGRVKASGDPVIAKSLGGAIAAIDEQKRQRAQVKLGADRLEAEHTRLLYTLEGLASQFVRLRTAGDGGAAGLDAQLEQGVQQLRQEIDAIADALQEVSAPAFAAKAAEAAGAARAAEAGQPAGSARAAIADDAGKLRTLADGPAAPESRPDQAGRGRERS